MRKNYKVLTSVKNPALNETQVISYLCLELASKATTTYVRKPITIGQYAWVDKKFISTHQRLNKKNLFKTNKILFEQWLVGLTDGTGTFEISCRKNQWYLEYKLFLSVYDFRVLNYIKKQLGIGSVRTYEKKSCFVVSNIFHLKTIILPIFHKYPLLTSKQFFYLKLKEGCVILENTYLSKDEKDKYLTEIKEKTLPVNYISSAWNKTESIFESVTDVKAVMTKPWIVGFTEAVSNFSLVSKDNNTIKHSFSISQKSDYKVLQGIRRILHISTSVKFISNNYYTLSTTNSRAIENIIKYFKNTRMMKKSMKGLSFRLWSKVWGKKQNKKRVKCQKILHRIESKVLFTKQSLVLTSYSKKSTNYIRVPTKERLFFTTKAGCFYPYYRTNVCSDNKRSAPYSFAGAKIIYCMVPLQKKYISTSATYFIPTRKPIENVKSFNSNKVKPEVSYINADFQKLQIIKDNKKKVGIYSWTNKVNGKIYIGSSMNLSSRFTSYYSLAFLTKELKTSQSIIYKALLKYGYSNFQLDILEYCERDALIDREQYYLNLLKPEYNILKHAGSSRGYKHTKATIELIRKSALNRKSRTLTSEHKNQIRKTLLGRERSKETKAKISANHGRAKPVIVTNVKTGVSQKFPSKKKASVFLETSPENLSLYIKSSKLLRGIYTIINK